MIVLRNLLMSNQPFPGVSAPAAGAWVYSPIIRTEAALEVLYNVGVNGLDGAPTTARLEMKFQSVLQTNGTIIDGSPQYFDLTDPAMLPDGNWPDPLANETLVAPVSVIRRIKGGIRHRLAWRMTFTGGTTPAFRLTIEQLQRYS